MVYYSIIFQININEFNYINDMKICITSVPGQHKL